MFKPENTPKVQLLRQFFWHGTRGQNLDSILKNGIRAAIEAKLGATQQFEEYHNDAIGIVCLTNHEGNGCFYATASYPMEKVNSDEFEPIVLQLLPSELDSNLLIKRLPSGDSACRIYRGSEELDYLSNIPSEAIVGYLKWDKQKKKYQYFKRTAGD